MNHKRMRKDELLKLIQSIPLDCEEFTILSSSALVLRDIYESAGDLDMAVTPKGLEQLREHYSLIQKENGWYSVCDQVECMVHDTKDIREKVGDYYLEDIHHYLAYLQISEREKDQLRIPLVEEYIKKR